MIRYFVHCPRGFANERILVATDDDKLAIKVKNYLDDGMDGTLDEVSEDDAKWLVFRKNIGIDIETAAYNMSDFPRNPKWNDIKRALILNTELEYANMR